MLERGAAPPLQRLKLVSQLKQEGFLVGVNAIPILPFISDTEEELEKIIAAAKKHGKALGRLVPNTDQGIQYYKQGFDFCCYSGDVWVLRDALTVAVKTLREGCK